MLRGAPDEERVVHRLSRRVVAVGACALVLAAGTAAILGATVWDGERSGTRVLLDETFDGPAGAPPDPKRWYRYDYCDGWTQVLSCNEPGNATLDGKGNLVLRA